MKKGTNALVIFGSHFPFKKIKNGEFDVIVAKREHEAIVKLLHVDFKDIEEYIDPGSVQAAATLLEELPQVRFSDGTRVCKSFTYKGFELWWIHYNNIFHHFCIPYFQYNRLLVFLTTFSEVAFFAAPYKTLFTFYLHAYSVSTHFMPNKGYGFKTLSLGISLQMILTGLSIPVLMFTRPKSLVFIGDKLEHLKDYDFRMKFVYQELRLRKVHFVEFVRSLETWKNVISNSLIRRRPVVYSEAVTVIGQFLAFITGGQSRSEKRFGIERFYLETNPEKRFKILLATGYLRNVFQDVWTIRIMKLILGMIGVRSALFTAAVERNFHTVLACKIKNIPTVGILHGVSSRQSTPYDFMNGFDGGRRLSLDTYGVWSEWWKEHYIKNSDTYSAKQLVVSGPMRPIVANLKANEGQIFPPKIIRVLFVAEQTATPTEVMPYLHELLRMKNISLSIKFRSFRDGFEDWLNQHEPEVLKNKSIVIVKGAMQSAIEASDVVIGCHSTGVLEALLQLKTPLFIRTRKWGDYYGMTETEKRRHFFVENPEQLKYQIANTASIPREILIELRDQYFGDPHRNGSAWAVTKLQENLGLYGQS